MPRVLHLTLAGVLLTACVDIHGPMPRAVSPNELLAEVEIDARAMLIKIGDTLPLGIRAISMDGHIDTIDPGDVIWASLDSGQVYVDTLGRVIGRRVSLSIPTPVVASYRRDIVTKTDTILVYVTPLKVDASTLRLVALDSLRVGAGSLLGVPRVRADLYQDDVLIQQGTFVPIAAPAPVTAVYLPTGGNEGEPVYQIQNEKGRLGQFWVHADLNLYGQLVRDSLLFTGTHAAALDITFFFLTAQDGSLTPIGEPVSGFTIQPCGVLMIKLFSARAIDIDFSDRPTSNETCAPISPQTINAIASQKFSTVFGDFIGTSILGMPGAMLSLRRSPIEGEITYSLKEHETSTPVPVRGTYRQIHIDSH